MKRDYIYIAAIGALIFYAYKCKQSNKALVSYIDSGQNLTFSNQLNNK